MTLWKIFLRRSREQNITASLEKSKFRHLPFKHTWNQLVQQYDLRMWYIHNSPHTSKSLQYTQELEAIHHELNYQNSRQILLRYLGFIALVYGFYAVYEMPKMIDWSETHEPKHAGTVYGDLEETPGTEGDD